MDEEISNLEVSSPNGGKLIVSFNVKNRSEQAANMHVGLTIAGDTKKDFSEVYDVGEEKKYAFEVEGLEPSKTKVCVSAAASSRDFEPPSIM